MLDTKSQNSNMLLAFLTLTGVIAIVALVGFFICRPDGQLFIDRMILSGRGRNAVNMRKNLDKRDKNRYIYV